MLVRVSRHGFPTLVQRPSNRPLVAALSVAVLMLACLSDAQATRVVIEGFQGAPGSRTSPPSDVMASDVVMGFYGLLLVTAVNSTILSVIALVREFRSWSLRV